MFNCLINEGLLATLFRLDMMDGRLVRSVVKIAHKSNDLTRALFDSLIIGYHTLSLLHDNCSTEMLNSIARQILIDSGDDIEAFLQDNYSLDGGTLLGFLDLRPSLAWSFVDNSIETQRAILEQADLSEFHKDKLLAVLFKTYE